LPRPTRGPVEPWRPLAGYFSCRLGGAWQPRSSWRLRAVDPRWCPRAAATPWNSEQLLAGWDPSPPL